MKRRIFGIPVVAIVLVLCVTVVGGVAFAITYDLDETVSARVTITAPAATPPPVEITLYRDVHCIAPVYDGYIHDFGTEEEGIATSWPLFFRPNEVSMETIVVTTSGLPDNLQLEYSVGLVAEEADHMGRLTLTVPATLPAGTYNGFTFRVVGTRS